MQPLTVPVQKSNDVIRNGTDRNKFYKINFSSNAVMA